MDERGARPGQAVRPRRLFAAELPALGGAVALSPEAAHHARVLRLGAGDRVQLFDGRLGQADAVITAVSREGVTCVAEPRVVVPAPSPALHLVLGLPKGGKLEDIARMLSELGVAALHLASCERSVPRPSGAAARLGRLERVVLEACAQSGQPLAPAVHPPRPLLEVAAQAPASASKVAFWERGDVALDDAFAAGPSPCEEVWAVVGPEGGLSEHEALALHARGFARVGLGRAILRVETAAPVIAALILDRLGRLRP